MFQRSLPPFPDLAAFLDHLKRQDDLISISEPVETHLEMAEVHRRVIESGGPAIRFDAPSRDGQACGLPALANLFGTRARVAAGLGTDEGGLRRLGELFAYLRSPKPPQGLREARGLLPVARSALASRPRVTGGRTGLEDCAPDLSQLPVQTCWPGDAGPLIAWPVVITRAPGADIPSSYNLGIYRMQVLDRDRAILRWLPMRGGAAHHRLWAARGEDMPVAVVIGADPATLLAAVMPAPEHMGELAIAGIVSGRRPEVTPCKAIPLHVPSGSEIVLEGTVSPSETALEGPFGDHTGYYNEEAPFPVFRLKHMRMRRNAIYLTTFTGRAPDEPSVIADALADVFLPVVREQIPEVEDIWLPPEAASYRIAVLAIDKRYPGQARRAMMGFWSLLPQFSMTKMLIAVDSDIDIRSWPDVMWAVATRADPARDSVIIDRTPIDPLDFASPVEGLGGKLGIDATKKIGSETVRRTPETLRMDKDIIDRVSARWDSLMAGAQSRRVAS